jgi:hypothetical protein
MRCLRGEQRKPEGERENPTYCWVKVRLSSQVMMGRFWRSLKVGRITEYMSLPLAAGAVFDFGAIVAVVVVVDDKVDDRCVDGLAGTRSGVALLAIDGDNLGRGLFGRITS